MNACRFSLRGLVLLGVLAVVGLGCSASALAARGHVFNSSFGEAGSGPGQFDEPAGVAVSESTGRVYVADGGNNRVEYFSSTGVYEGEFNGSGGLSGEGVAAGHGGVAGEVETGEFSKPSAIAVDNSKEASDPSAGDVYVLDTGHQVIDKYSAEGAYLGQLTGGDIGHEVSGVAVDPRGKVWADYNVGLAEFAIDSFSDAQPNEFVASVPVVGLNSFGNLEPGLAVDAADNLYVTGRFEAKGNPEREESGESEKMILKWSGSGAVLTIGFGAENANWPAEETASEDVYMSSPGSVARVSSNGSLIENSGQGKFTHAAGVAVDSVSEALYVADSAADVVDVGSPEPPGHPTIENESLSAVTGDSATLEAAISPRGENTEYRFEYGVCASLAACASSPYEASVPVPDGFVGSDFNVYNITAHPQDLLARTTYHFRVVAHNDAGSVDREGQVFTTQAGGELGMLDGREWEMVSPVDKDGALFGTAENQPQASVNGGAFVDSARSPSEADPQGNAGNVSVLFRRTSNGWSSKVLAVPHENRTGIGATNEFRLFSDDLSSGVLQPAGNFLALSPRATESTPYLRTDYLNGDVESPCESSCFTPLVTSANTPSGKAFGGEQNGECLGLTADCGPKFVGASPDLSHVVFTSKVQLTSTPIRSDEGLYVWAGEKLQLVNALPAGEEAEAGGVAAFEPQLGEEEHSIGNRFVERGTVSNDGRIIWTGRSKEGGPYHLYLRDMAKEETVRIDAPQGGQEQGDLNYMTASSDGSKIFFLETPGLTSEGSESGQDLYEYDLDAPVGSRLTDLTVDKNLGEAASVAGVIGASEDGSYVYFVDSGALAEGAEPGGCAGGKELCNLYVRHGGKTTFIAALSQEDVPDWSNPKAMPARVSPDGQWLEFMSSRDLTGYNPDDAVSGRPDEEVYLYSAASGRVACASCNPTGARPVGVRSTGELGEGLTGIGGIWDAKWVASTVPPWAPFESFGIYQPRYLSDSGRLFFDSHDALVPQDVNGAEDVYEYEPAGIGDCATSSEAFSERSGGCVGLISSGSSSEESAFLDASGSGGDVFFLTAAKLVPGDSGSEQDIYDAHECSEQAPCFAPAAVAPPACSTGDSCKAAPAPQPAIFGDPASATFTGAGNLAQPVVKTSVKSNRSHGRRSLRVLWVYAGRSGIIESAWCVNEKPGAGMG